MVQKTKDILIAMMNSLKAPLLSFLEKEAVKVAIAKLVQSPFMADFRIWAIKFAVDYLVKDFIQPAINYFFQKVGYEYEVIDGKHLLKEIKNSPDIGTWDHNTDRV